MHIKFIFLCKVYSLIPHIKFTQTKITQLHSIIALTDTTPMFGTLSALTLLDIPSGVHYDHDKDKMKYATKRQ